MTLHYQGALYHTTENIKSGELISMSGGQGYVIRQNANTRYYELYEITYMGEALVSTYTDIIDAIQQGRKWT